jgi:hypothetical protein
MAKRLEDSLNKSLFWALEKMQEAGYPVTNKVTLQIDPSLRFMGYAKQDGSHHVIVMADWALDSEMLGGFLLHELSHIYHTEKGTASHRSDIIHEVIDEIVTRDGLTQKETQYVIDAFNHLQNILADDIVFEIMNSDREAKQVQKFFAGWISDRPSGDAALDAALLARNAFAIASLKRRDLYDGTEDEVSARNRQFLSIMGGNSREDFANLERFLAEARTDWEPEQFRKALSAYLENLVSIMRHKQESWGDLR